MASRVFVCVIMSVCVVTSALLKSANIFQGLICKFEILLLRLSMHTRVPLTSNQVHIYKVWFDVSRLLWLVPQTLRGETERTRVSNYCCNGIRRHVYCSSSTGSSGALDAFVNTQMFGEAHRAFRLTQLLALLHCCAATHTY